MDRQQKIPKVATREIERAIHAELLAARRRPGGLSPEAMAEYPVLSEHLGDGDPEIAHVELYLKLMEILQEEDDVTALEAACYSLGLASDADTHLARLEEFGAKHFIDQRQARRYSDRGLQQLARLIATHWTTQTVPEATMTVIGMASGQLGIGIQLRRQRHLHMRQPSLDCGVDGTDGVRVGVRWQRTSADDAPWVEHELTEPFTVDVSGQTTVRMIWRGDTWPKFVVAFSGDIDAALVAVETLGPTCAVTIDPDFRAGQ